MPDERVQDLWGFVNVSTGQANKFSNKTSAYAYPTINVFGPNDFLKGGEEKHQNHSYVNFEPFYGIYLGPEETIMKSFGLVDMSKVLLGDLVGIFMNGVVVFTREYWVHPVGNTKAKRMIQSASAEESRGLAEPMPTTEALTQAASFATQPSTGLSTKRHAALTHATKSETHPFIKERILQKFITWQPL